jgi:hypothetical protein
MYVGTSTYDDSSTPCRNISYPEFECDVSLDMLHIYLLTCTYPTQVALLHADEETKTFIRFDAVATT